MLKPGEVSNFRIEFSDKNTYTTLYGMFEQFLSLKVEKFEIEVYGYTCKQEKKSVFFKNEVGSWSPEKLQLDKLENLFAIMREHGNKEAFFNIVYYNPFTKTKTSKGIDKE